MKDVRIKDLPVVEERQSTYILEELISRLSALNTTEHNVYSDFGEVFLCLAQEIKQIKGGKMEHLFKVIGDLDKFSVEYVSITLFSDTSGKIVSGGKTIHNFDKIEQAYVFVSWLCDILNVIGRGKFSDEEIYKISKLYRG